MFRLYIRSIERSNLSTLLRCPRTLLRIFCFPTRNRSDLLQLWLLFLSLWVECWPSSVCFFEYISYTRGLLPFLYNNGYHDWCYRFCNSDSTSCSCRDTYEFKWRKEEEKDAYRRDSRRSCWRHNCPWLYNLPSDLVRPEKEIAEESGRAASSRSASISQPSKSGAEGRE